MRIHQLRTLAWIIAVCAVCNLSCGSKTPEKPDANQPEPSTTRIEPTTVMGDVNTARPEPGAEKLPAGVLVTVDGVDITEEQLEQLIKPALARLAQQASNVPAAFLEQRKKLLRDQALEEMIRMQLLRAKVTELGITTNEEEIDSEIKDIAARQKPPVSAEDLKKKIELFGYDFDEWREQVRMMLSRNKLIARQFPDRIKVTEADARQHYEQNKAMYGTPEQVRASHILIKPDLSDPNSDPNQAKAAAKAKAEDLLKQINEGADFAELAKKHSACPSASNGGDLGLTGRGVWVPPFEKAAFDLEVGKVSAVVETDFGYHIIKATDHKDATTKPFDEVKETVLNQLSQAQLVELTKEYLEKLKAEAKIVPAPGKEPRGAPGSVLPPGGAR